jgi:hypothetical protein
VIESNETIIAAVTFDFDEGAFSFSSQQPQSLLHLQDVVATDCASAGDGLIAALLFIAIFVFG